jgi:hypothetical protein
MVAIKRALQLNPVGGYVKGSCAREQLDAAFECVPLSSAQNLYDQLTDPRDILGKLFRYRLASPTRLTMLKILGRKAEDYRALIRAEEVRKIEEYRKNTCERWKKEDMSIESVCRGSFIGRGRGVFKPGDPVKCQELKDEAERARTQDRIKGVRCP